MQCVMNDSVGKPSLRTVLNFFSIQILIWTITELENGSRPVFDNSKDVVKFSLENNQEKFSVDLLSGNISINGKLIALYSADSSPLTSLGKVYRLIYFKRVTQTISTSFNIPAQTSMTYFLGWQMTCNGVNVKRILEILSDGRVRLRSDTFDVPEKLYDLEFEDS